jgi:hypothetical protein
VFVVKKRLEIFGEMQDKEYNITHPIAEIIHPYYMNGYLRCLNDMFDILEMYDDIPGIEPEYLFGDAENKLLPIT